MVALPHRTGMLPIDHNPHAAAFLDWLFMFVKGHVQCIFEKRVTQNFGRMKDGYEGRHMAGAMWMQGILAFAANEDDQNQAARDAAMACYLTSIPITEVRPHTGKMHWISRDTCACVHRRRPLWPLTSCIAECTRG